jgi:DnaK suppressor protein
MPVKTCQDTASLQATLLARKALLHDEIRTALARARSEPLADVLRQPHDLGDEAWSSLSAHLILAEVRRDVTELRQIESALRRIGCGSYGVCAACGDAIDAARLAATPSALRCISCEAALDRVAGVQRTCA